MTRTEGGTYFCTVAFMSKRVGMCVRTTLRVAKHVCEVRNISLFGSKEQVLFRITVGLILMYCYVRHCSNEIVLQFSVKNFI